MKTKSLLIILLACCLTLTGCFREKYLDCPEGRYIYLRSATGNYNCEDIAERVDLYLYDSEGNLVGTYSFDRDEIIARDYKLPIPFQPAGEYTLVAQVNFSEDDYMLIGIDNLFGGQCGLVGGALGEITRKQADIYHGFGKIVFGEGPDAFAYKTDIIDIYKNTKNIELEVSYHKSVDADTRRAEAVITGNNGVYKYDNSNAAECFRRYYPHTNGGHTFSFTTMHFYCNSDMTLTVDLYKRPSTRAGQEGTLLDSQELNIAGYLAQVRDNTGAYLYDTDEKLALEDEFFIQVMFGDKHAMIGLWVNGWAVIKPSEIL